MRDIDAAAPDLLDVLVERAGAEVARAAVRMMRGTYGRRVVILAGKGNNGADGRAAGRRLSALGISVTVLDAADLPAQIGRCDLVIDAAYGTGFRGSWTAPKIDSSVLAVDIVSGVDGLTGQAADGVAPADRTITFAALKPGLLFPPGRDLAGAIEVADIGLSVGDVFAHLVERSDVVRWLPRRRSDDHKWRSAVWVIAGSPGMLGASHLASRAAQRAGAGMVRLSTPGVAVDPMAPTEAVRQPLSPAYWAQEVLEDADRFHAMIIGPGLGRADGTGSSVRELVAKAPVPLVVDGDGLFALGWSNEGAAPLLAARSAPTILTPHDGEFALLRGARVGPDRIEAARRLSADLGAIVVLKGATTVVAEPGGHVLVVTSGDERLATAGTGDVLSGIIGALLAQQMHPFEAAAVGAWLHGAAALLGPSRGLVAGDLPDLLPRVLEDL